MICVIDIGFIAAGVLLNYVPVAGVPWYVKAIGAVLALVYTARLAADWTNK